MDVKEKTTQAIRVQEIWESVVNQSFLDLVIISPKYWADKHGVSQAQTRKDIDTIIEGRRLERTDRKNKYRVRK